MNILFDLSASQPNSSKYHGGGEYAKAVFEHLISLNKGEKINRKIIACYNPNKWLDPSLRDLIEKEDIGVEYIRNKVELQLLINNGKFDRFYSALPYNYYDLDFSDVEFFFTIHGLRPVEMPTDIFEYRYHSRVKSKLIYFYKHIFSNKYVSYRKKKFEQLLSVKAKKITIIVPSLHTKFSLINNFPDLQTKTIHVLYSPRKTNELCDDDPGDDTIERKFGVKKRKYFLLISADRWIKNSMRAVIALDQLFCDFKNNDLEVLILGVSNNQGFNRLINKPKFKYFGYVEDRELDALYKNAYAFIYPSLNEGFGYPPLESMKHVTPVLASAIASITEICGDAVIYFNPYCIQEIKNRILMLFLQAGVWEKYAELGYRRYQEIAEKQDRALNDLCHLILKD